MRIKTLIVLQRKGNKMQYVRKITYFFATLFLLITFLSGCASKEVQAKQQIVSQGEGKTAFYEPTKFRLKPVIGSRNNDARTVVDMGTLLKIWVAPYKGRNGVLTSSHDIYAWARMPDFVVGEEVPTAPSLDDGSGMVYNHKLPASFSSEEVDRSAIQDDKNIQEFVNGFNKFVEKELTKESTSEPLKEESNKAQKTKVDKDILEFIKSKRTEKGNNDE